MQSLIQNHIRHERSESAREQRTAVHKIGHYIITSLVYMYVACVYSMRANVFSHPYLRSERQLLAKVVSVTIETGVALIGVREVVLGHGDITRSVIH